jgi:hypothetical protein
LSQQGKKGRRKGLRTWGETGRKGLKMTKKQEQNGERKEEGNK